MNNPFARVAIFSSLVVILGAARMGDASPNPTPAPSATVAATPRSGSPLLVGLWKGYVPSLSKSVFIAWVQPASASSHDVVASIDDVFALIIPKLKRTPYSIFIVNVEIVDASGGNRSSERGFIFVLDHDGRWQTVSGSDIADKGAFVDQIIKAGLPQSPGAEGGETMAAPLNPPASPTPKPHAT